jgi:hypothetical protein
MRIGHHLLRFLNSLVLLFSISAAFALTPLIGFRGYAGVAVFIILFVGIYLGLAKLFDIYFKIPK